MEANDDMFTTILGLIISLIISWSIGLFLPILIRYVFYKRALSKKEAGWFAFANSFLNFILSVTMAIAFPDYWKLSNEKNLLLPYVILFFGARWVMTRPTAPPKIKKAEEKKVPVEHLSLGRKTFRFFWKTVFCLAGTWLGVLWIITIYAMLKKDIENELFTSGFVMFVSRSSSLALITFELIISLYLFSYIIQKTLLVKIIRFIEWIIFIIFLIMGTVGIANYLFMFLKGEGFYPGTIIFNLFFVGICLLVLWHLFKIPASTRIYQNLKISWTNNKALKMP